MAAPEAGAPAAPAASRRQSRCTGYKQGADMEDCVFSTAVPGTPAYPHANGGMCVFCCPERMLAAVQDSKKKKHLTQALNKFKEKSRDVHQRAVGRLRAHLSTEHYKAAVTPTDHCVGLGEQLCARSSRGDGGPARAARGRLCAGCAQEQKNVENSGRVALALAGLCTWARAMTFYVDIAKVV